MSSTTDFILIWLSVATAMSMLLGIMHLYYKYQLLKKEKEIQYLISQKDKIQTQYNELVNAEYTLLEKWKNSEKFIINQKIAELLIQHFETTRKIKYQNAPTISDCLCEERSNPGDQI